MKKRNVFGSASLVLLVLVSVVCLSGLALAARDKQKKAASSCGDGKLRIIAFGAHPDDAEIGAGGVAIKWAEKGHHVKFVSTTHGCVGHWKIGGGELAKRRIAEARHAAKILGIDETEVLDNHDGELVPSLENRIELVRLIRQWKADIVMSHRPNDYHSDHRYTGVLVQDTAYLAAIPFQYTSSTAPPIASNPVILFYEDRFLKPYPFQPDVVVAIDDVIDKKLEALSVFDSQFVEGGCCAPKEGLIRAMIPKDQAELEARRAEVRTYFAQRFEPVANKYRDKLIELYGEEKGKKVRYAEAFELCEYGRQPSAEELKKLFPFFER